MKLHLFILLLINVSYTHCVLECCSNPNVIEKGKCKDGNNTTLNCKKYILRSPTNESLTVFEDHLLVDDDIIIPPTRYCLTSTTNYEEVALVCHEENPYEPFWMPRIICTFISILFLVLTIATYLLVPELRDLQGECILNSICGLTSAFLSLGILQTVVFEDIWCVSIAVITYFTFLYCFFWLNIVSFHVWRIVVKSDSLENERQWKKIYYCYGVGAPLIFLGALLIGQFAEGQHIKPNIGAGKCWFDDMTGTFVYFYGPISILLCINIILFVWTSKILWQSVPQDATRKTKVLRYRLSLYIKLFFIMGLSWIFEILSAIFEKYGTGIAIIWTITDYVNALQGVMIFILLVVTRKRALKGLARRKICCIKFPDGWKRIEDEEEDSNEIEEMRLSNVAPTV